MIGAIVASLKLISILNFLTSQELFFDEDNKRWCKYRDNVKQIC